MNPLAGLSPLAVIIFPGKREEPPPHTLRTSQEEKLSTSLLQSNSEERGILPTFTGPHQGTAAGNTPSPGTAGESQLTTDKTENRQTGNNIKT